MIYEGLTETEKPNKRLRDITLEGRHFNEIANSVKAFTSVAEQTEVTNSLYKPEVVEYLLTHTMPYVGMWSGMHEPQPQAFGCWVAGWLSGLHVRDVLLK